MFWTFFRRGRFRANYPHLNFGTEFGTFGGFPDDSGCVSGGFLCTKMCTPVNSNPQKSANSEFRRAESARRFPHPLPRATNPHPQTPTPPPQTTTPRPLHLRPPRIRNPKGPIISILIGCYYFTYIFLQVGNYSNKSSYFNSN